MSIRRKIGRALAELAPAEFAKTMGKTTNKTEFESLKLKFNPV